MTNSETVGACANCEADIPRDHGSASCPRCGETLSVEINRRLRNPESASLLAKRSILPYDDLVPPVEEVAAAPAGVDPRVAGPMIRAAARLIDMFAGILISFPATLTAFLLLALLGTPGGMAEWAPRMRELSVAVFLFSFVGQSLYFTLSEWIGGATLGKLACGLRVVSEDFSPPTLRGAFVRAISFVFDSLFFGLIALHAMQQGRLRQRYGDKWGRTIVVKHRDVPGSDRGWPRILLGVALGGGLWALAETYSLVSRVLAVH
ncbi:MAG: RDD family protein [Acidobacteriota bacterium]